MWAPPPIFGTRIAACRASDCRPSGGRRRQHPKTSVNCWPSRRPSIARRSRARRGICTRISPNIRSVSCSSFSLSLGRCSVVSVRFLDVALTRVSGLWLVVFFPRRSEPIAGKFTIVPVYFYPRLECARDSLIRWPWCAGAACACALWNKKIAWKNIFSFCLLHWEKIHNFRLYFRVILKEAAESERLL